MEYLNRLKKFYRKNRRLPSYSEMLELFRLSSKNAIHKIVQKLVDEGFLEKKDNKISPTSQFFALPLLGIVKAGFPILADANRSYMSLDEFLIDDPTSSFLLKVSGDSMSGVGIFDGDIAVIEKKKVANPGELVLAQIDGEWTLKILSHDYTTKITFLSAANPNYPPLYPRQELTIFGTVKGVIRKY